MPIRLYTDEHIPTAVAQALRLRGIDVLTTPEAGIIGASDEDHLAFAASRQRVMLTKDADFLRLHAQGISHAGIIYAPRSRSIGEMVRGLLIIHDVLSEDEMRNHVEYL